jgi:hypothetical protein
MASAAGAPPPPPPPPPPPQGSSSFDDLPAELLLEIWEYLGFGSSMQFVLALFPTLRRHSLTPPLSVSTYMRIIRDDSQSRAVGGDRTEVLGTLPIELWLQIAELVNSRDSTSLMFALAGQFFRVQEGASQETKERLSVWSRRKQ